jgi:hypothetical protein
MARDGGSNDADRRRRRDTKVRAKAQSRPSTARLAAETEEEKVLRGDETVHKKCTYMASERDDQELRENSTRAFLGAGAGARAGAGAGAWARARAEPELEPEPEPETGQEQEPEPEPEPEPESEPELELEPELVPEPALYASQKKPKEGSALEIWQSWMKSQPKITKTEEEHEGRIWQMQAEAFQRDMGGDGWCRFRTRQRLAAARVLTLHATRMEEIQAWDRCALTKHEKWLQYVQARKTERERLGEGATLEIRRVVRRHDDRCRKK